MNKKDFLVVIFLTLLSPLLTGYYFGILDHDHYLSYLNKILNPALYPGDYFFSQAHSSYSWFNYFIVWIHKLSGLDLAWTHLFIYLISLCLFYLAVYSLAKTIYRQTNIAILAVIFLLLPKWASQIGYMTHHFYFVSRDLSLALSLLALNLILLKKFRLSFFLLLPAFIINPSIPIPVVLMLPLVIKQSNLVLFPINSSWLSTMQQRGTYSFPHLWHWMGWGTFLYYFSLLGISWRILKHQLFGQLNRPLKKFILICVSLFLLHLIISCLFPVPVLIQLQLLRSVNYIFIISLITIAAAIVKLLHSGHFTVKIAAIIAAFSLYFWSDHLTVWHIILVWLLPLVHFIFPKKNYSLPTLTKKLTCFLIIIILSTDLLMKLLIIKPVIYLPHYWMYPNELVSIDQYHEWRQVQDWAKFNTPIEAVFMVPPNWSGFRSFSQRSIVADAKDGGVVFYSPAYAREWQHRLNDLKNYRNFSTDDFKNLQFRYQFQYIITTSDHQPLNFNLVYQNQNFSVYRL